MSGRVSAGKLRYTAASALPLFLRRMSTPTLSDDELKKKLTTEQFHIMREKGTEAPFTGKYWNCKDDGTYTCAACGKELFRSDDKFNSGCGWPSFDKAIGAVKPKDSDNANVIFKVDTSNGMQRTEVLCKNCHSHLGHIFDDGPTDTGMRYCINSACLNFKKKT